MGIVFPCLPSQPSYLLVVCFLSVYHPPTSFFVDDMCSDWSRTSDDISTAKGRVIRQSISTVRQPTALPVLVSAIQ